MRLKPRRMLTTKLIKQRIKQNKSHLLSFGVDSIGIFGSYVRGEQHENSDIDLLVSFKEGQETFNNFMDLYFFLEEIFQDEKIEVVTKGGLSPYIAPTILKEVVYVEV